MKIDLGIMQGRLLPKYKGRYQAHPRSCWENEFLLASDLGLKSIEFILDFEHAASNPLMHAMGHKKISLLEEETGVGVYSICADYFMLNPLHGKSRRREKQAKDTLLALFKNITGSKIQTVVLPCVDSSSLKLVEHRQRFVSSLNELLSDLPMNGVSLCLETDLPPIEFANLLSAIGSTRVTVNYDVGNSASLGYDTSEELEAYGDLITDIHIKDRVLDGPSVIFGSGNGDFQTIFNWIKRKNYEGLLICQLYRDDEGLVVFKNQLSKLKEFIDGF